MCIAIPHFLFAQHNIDVIIPKPQKLIRCSGTFQLNKQSHYLSDTSLANSAINYLQSHLKRNAGYSLQKPTAARETLSAFTIIRERSKDQKPTDPE